MIIIIYREKFIMSLIGYARVSTSEGKQLLDRQVDALTEIGWIFEDKASGSNSQRKGLDDCLNYLRKGDVLVVLDLDRLGRLASDLIKLIDELAEKDIGFKAINSPMDTTTPAGRAFLQIQARARGRKGGRPRIMTAEKLRYAQHLMADQTKSIPAICKELGDIPSSTLYHYVTAKGELKKAGVDLLNSE